MEHLVCETCGGTLIRKGNHYVCRYCGHMWVIDVADDIHAVERANAWASLRNGDFEGAIEQFDNIIIKEDQNYEAYWGRALAQNGITYVADIQENKKVPTCNNITEQEFLKNSDVKKAISLAPADIAASYKQQAELIESIRIEWLEKASKEPAYDVFICFKDKDKENGIERTQDSYDAQDLYYALVEEGYKVFFSHVSLKDKTSEQFEPYIYNAIKTAKVMIVFGEKPEYFSAVWLKNEWSRFAARIKKGEKHKNSLVVVYKNLDPGDLPVVLKTRQCLNAADITFLSDLTRHIKRVIEETKNSALLERIEITGGQISRKATSLSVNAVQTHEVGIAAIAEYSLNERQSISLINTYLKATQWSDAEKLIDDVLFENPTCAEAIWCRLLAKKRIARSEDVIGKLDKFTGEDFATVEKYLNCAPKESAQSVLRLLYDSVQKTSVATYEKILDTILPFSFEERQMCIDMAFDGATKSQKLPILKKLIGTLQSTEVDKYISLHYRYAMNTKDRKEKKECLENILEIDEGNIEALREILFFNLTDSLLESKRERCLENLLKYTTDIPREIEGILSWLCNNLSRSGHCDFAKKLLQYYPGELFKLRDKLIDLSKRILQQGYFKDVEYFLQLILSFSTNDPEAYWLLCLMRVGAATEEDVLSKDVPLSSVPEFNKYLILVDESRKNQCVNLLTKQRENIERRECQKELANALHEQERLVESQKNLGYVINGHEDELKKFDPKYKGVTVPPFVSWLVGIGSVVLVVLVLYKSFTSGSLIGMLGYGILAFPLAVSSGVGIGFGINYIQSARIFEKLYEARKKQKNINEELQKTEERIKKLQARITKLDR